MKRSPIRVLLIDDDEDDFIIARDLFREVSPTAYTVEWSSTYEHGWEAMRRRPFDVFLVDFQLNGRTVLEFLREARAFGNQSPMILLTGVGSPDVDIQAMRAGAEDFLVKGQITPASLERAVRYAIERNRAEREIQKLAAFPRSNPNPVLEFSADGTILYANDASQKMAASFGVASLELAMPPETKSIIAQCLLTGENQFNLQSTLQKRTISWSFIPIPANGVVHCYATDITERLNLEAQLRHSLKMEAIGQLAAGVAHDFNNILTVIQGHVDLLISVPPGQIDLNHSLEQIRQATERAGNLIRQLLMFSRKQVLQPRYVDLNEIITNISRMVQRLLGEHISFSFVSAQGLPSIYADVGMIEQVLVNLAINSRDAMPHGGRLVLTTSRQVIEASASRPHPEARAGEFVCLSVKDSGCGMDATTLSHLFEPFFTTKDTGKGTGLGLATVYGIVQLHHGWIVVESQVGVGSTFTIFFPIGTKPAEAIPQPPGTRPLPVKGGTETILVVEDEPALRSLVVSILELYGYRVFQAPTGVSALKVWEQHKSQIDLLLTDMVMPEGMSGRQLAERLLQENPLLCVIYTSGYSPGMAGKDIALMEGFNFLPKPYPPSRLAQVVRESLDSRATV